MLPLRTSVLAILMSVNAFHIDLMGGEINISGMVVDDSPVPMAVEGAQVMQSVLGQTFDNVLTDAAGGFSMSSTKTREHVTFQLLVFQGRRFEPWSSSTLTAKAGTPFRQDGITLKRFMPSTTAIRQVKMAEEFARGVDPESPVARELLAWATDLEKPLGAVQMRILVPAYFYPSGSGLTQWQTLIHSAKSSKVQIYAIVNPSSGAGRTLNSDYARVLKEANSAGVRLIGYISTKWGKRPIEEVTAEISVWKDLYPAVTGLFVDEMSTDAKSLSYYSQLNSTAQATLRDCEVVMNPGVPPMEDYIRQGACPNCVLFENQAAELKSFRTPVWVKDYPADRFAVLVYNDPQSNNVQSRIEWAKKNHIGWVYFTDRFQKDGGVNPWSVLPTYWKEMVDAVAKANAEK